MTNRENILQANAYGLRTGVNGGSYYTPIFEMARLLGMNGLDLSAAPVVSGYRYGDAPELGISRNYREDIAEHGLSLAAIDGGKEIGSCVWFCDRPIRRYNGVLVGTGSDDEAVILPFGFEVFD
jgi:hypothetical protein